MLRLGNQFVDYTSITSPFEEGYSPDFNVPKASNQEFEANEMYVIWPARHCKEVGISWSTVNMLEITVAAIQREVHFQDPITERLQ